jgi:hypothetical protein
MSFLKGSWVHLGLFAASAALAAHVWLKGATPAQASGPEARVEVWSGRADAVEKIEWDGKQKVVLEAQKDALGRFFVGTLEKTVQVLQPSAKPDEPPQKPKHTRTRFVSVKGAQELAASLAPLRAFRSLGRYDAARAEEFGFKEPEGTLRVTLGGTTHSLIVGGATPGGADRYARLEDGSAVFAVPGDLVRNLSHADSRLPERELQPFEMKEVDRVRITTAQGTRELVRVPDRDEGWADPSTPTTLDETAGNWMGKLHRLRPVEYVETPPALGPEASLVRVEYFSGSRSRGSVELVKGPPKKDGSIRIDMTPSGSEDTIDKPRYLVRTPHTRWFTEVIPSAGEEVGRDVASVMKTSGAAKK